MERNNLIKKGVVVAVILLFIGLAFAPSINANISKPSIDGELVEITTEICGLNGEKHTVSLSKEEAEEVENLINDIERRLDEVETREETVEIFNEAVVELDKYGLLGGLSVEQAQRLVNGGYQSSRIMKPLESIGKKYQGIFNRNIFCLVTGRTNYTVCVHRLNPWIKIGSEMGMGMYQYILSNIVFRIVAILNEKFPILAELLLNLAISSMVIVVIGYIFILDLYTFLRVRVENNPLALFNVFGVGYYYEQLEEFRYAPGWVWSIGLLGIRKWEGELLGNLPGIKIPYDIFFDKAYPAIWGFNGIKIGLNDDFREKWYLGSAIAAGFDIK